MQMNDKKLGKYTIIKELGKGGMAVVYLAHHDDIDRYVAMKVLNPEKYNNPKMQARFKLEARSIAKLEHQYILPIFDFGHDETSQESYIVMRYVSGGTLSDRIEERQMSMEAIAQILNHVGSALDYAHSHDILHRDIKPSNILMDDKGIAFLSDFGIAKHIDGDVITITESESVIGTPYYMSPEQCRGESDTLTPASDIYSLGVVLFEMLTGQIPYDGGTPLKTVYSHLQKPIPKISDFRTELGMEFQALINKAMAKSPDDRFKSCKELEAAFLQAVQHFSLPNKLITNETPESEQDDALTIPERHPAPESEAPAQNKSILMTGPLGFVTVRLIVPDLNKSEPATARNSVIARDFLKEACKAFGISSRNRTLLLNGNALDLSRTLGQNNVPQKAELYLVEQEKTGGTLDWIRNNTPKEFEAGTLIFLVDESTRQRHQLRWQPAIIGRVDPRPDIPHINDFLAVDLSNRDVDVRTSRQHACITRKAGQYYIENLNVKNKTYLNNEALENYRRYPIQAGDRIRVGKIILIFQINL
jgi:serine/threonine protein kinase